MNILNLQLGFMPTTLEVPCLFVDHYMTDCPAVYPLIYIFSLRHAFIGKKLSMQDIASHFNITESDVLSAWKHWESLNIIKAEGDNITFLPVQEPVKPVQMTDAQIQAPAQAQPLQATVRPHYTTEELAAYRTECSEVERIFACAEDTLGKLLSYNDMNVIFGFHDWLRLPFDVIEYLLSYCKDNDHRNLRYIEKCAIDWHDNDIDDVEKALLYVQNFDKGYRTILNYMGQTSGYPTQSHRKFIDKWIKEWNMPTELILESCDRSVEATNKPKFSYMDKVLSTWHKNGITTLEAVKTADAEFIKSKDNIIPVDIVKAKQPVKTNRFANFNQRDNDYSHFEQLERAYLAQKLGV